MTTTTIETIQEHEFYLGDLKSFRASFIDKTTNDCFVQISEEGKASAAAEAEYNKRLKAGHCVSKNTITQWIEFHECLDENGRETYKGKAGEERVKGNRILVTLHNIDKPHGERHQTREVLGTSWRKCD